MKKLSLIVLTTILSLGFIACDSKVTTPEDVKKEEDLKAQNSSSSLELLENNSSKAIESCSPQNSLKFLLTQNSEKIIYCRESTSLDSTLSEGPVCSGGVKLVSFESKTKWVLCDELSVCGQKAKTVFDLAANGSTQMRQLQFTGLPWGCTGEIEVATKEDMDKAELIKKIPIEVKAPACPMCDVSNTRTCEICGVDNKAPEILDVITESSQCNRIRILVFAQDDNSGLNAEAYSFDAGITWQADSFKDFTGLNLAITEQKVWVRDRAGNISKYAKAVAATASPCPCDTPWGERIEHGQVRTAYKTSTVACTTTCAANSQQRTCNNGVLSGTAEFVAKSCQVTGCPKCKLPWGDEIDHGVKVTGYNHSTAACAGECESGVLSCEQGVLKGNVSVYKYKSCQSSRPSCDCRHLGMVIANGQKRKVFAAPEVNCGSTCQEGEVTCVSGELQGNTTYQNASCSPKICKCLTTWGQQIDANQTVDAYKAATMSCDQNMACDNAANKISIKCTDVITNKFELTAGTGQIADFKQPSCSSASCACTHLGMQFKPTDPPLKVYKIEKGVSPDKCELAGNVGEVRCIKSGSNFITQGDTNTNIYKFTQCQNGVGNDTGDGEGFRRRLKGGGGGGSGCDINQPPYYCYGADGGASVNISMCNLPIEDGYVFTPVDDSDYSQRITPGGYLSAYSRKEVTCGDSCSKYMGIVSCDHGLMSNKTKYPYLNCKEVCP
jgi:hypothetical protein